MSRIKLRICWLGACPNYIMGRSETAWQRLSPPFRAENYQVNFLGLILEVWLPAYLQFTRELHTLFTKCWPIGRSAKTPQITLLSPK